MGKRQCRDRLPNYKNRNVMKRIIDWIFLMIVFSYASFSVGQTYTVNTVTPQYDNSLPVTAVNGPLNTMIHNAVVMANTGVNVEIKLDVGQLIPTLLPLYPFNNTAGKITITGNSPNEGISGPYGFKYWGSSGDVVIKNLTIKNCVEAAVQVQRATPSNVILSHFTFENNTIIDCNHAFFGRWGKRGTAHIIIRNNTIVNSDIELHFNGDYDFITKYPPYLYSNFGDVLITNNSLSTNSGSHGIWINREECSGNGYYVSDLKIENNTIEGYDEAILLHNHIKYWEFIDNTLINNKRGFYFYNHTNYSDNFVNIRELRFEGGYGNYGNEIINSRFAFLSAGNFDIVRLQNYSFEGGVQSHNITPVEITTCLIKKPHSYNSWSPISNMSGTNNNIPKPMPTSAIQNSFGGGITVTFNLSGYDAPANGPFYVEFFDAATDYSLLEYIHTENNIDVTLTQPHTVTLPNVFSHGKIGMTIISKRTGTFLNGEIGTSEVAYIDVERDEVCSTFNPSEDEKYWISAWVNVATPNAVKSYGSDPVSTSDAHLSLEFIGSSSTIIDLYPSGAIIDGWQRVVGSFTIPAYTVGLGLELHAADISQGPDTHFDDIRLHPFNASMKSYVYDGETFWLTSELDDNNFATFYEYDNEGGLIRIKKETARGIVTIQETRSSSPKK